MSSCAGVTLSLIIISQQLFCTVVSMQVNASVLTSVMTPELKILVTIFEKHGLKNGIRIVGGAVRDLLSDQEPADVDLATTSTPREMEGIFRARNIFMFNKPGEKHGTVSVRINDKQSFEITSLNRCTKVDGTIIDITFTRDWAVDASRRDFTVNAMYLDFEGNVYDFYNGYEDLKNNRVRFIGEANERIRADPILIPRYFRAFAKVAKNANDPHDESVLQAIRDYAPRLDKIVGHRMWNEFHKILVGNFGEEIVKQMLNLGLAPHLGFGEDDFNITSFEFVINRGRKCQLRAITLAVSLCTTDNQVKTFCKRMMLSNFDGFLARFIFQLRNETFPDGDDECFRYCQRMLLFKWQNQEAYRAALVEVLKIADREAVMKLILGWPVPEFKIDTGVLKKRGIVGQRQVGQCAKKLKEAWFDNNFKFTESLFEKVMREFLNETAIV